MEVFHKESHLSILLDAQKLYSGNKPKYHAILHLCRYTCTKLHFRIMPLTYIEECYKKLCYEMHCICYTDIVKEISHPVT